MRLGGHRTNWSLTGSSTPQASRRLRCPEGPRKHDQSSKQRCLWLGEPDPMSACGWFITNSNLHLAKNESKRLVDDWDEFLFWRTFQNQAYKVNSSPTPKIGRTKSQNSGFSKMPVWILDVLVYKWENIFNHRVLRTNRDEFKAVSSGSGPAYRVIIGILILTTMQRKLGRQQTCFARHININGIRCGRALLIKLWHFRGGGLCCSAAYGQSE